MKLRCFDDRFSNGDEWYADSLAADLAAKEPLFRALAEEADLAEPLLDADEYIAELMLEYQAILEVEHGDEWIPASMVASMVAR